MLKIYKNKTTTFKCEVHVESEGNEINDIKSRLILYPSNDNRNVMFEGVVQDNICTIDINPNININKNGKAMLEIIVDDSTIFMPWNSLYEILTETVKVESAQVVYDANRAKVVVKEIKDEVPKKKKIETNKSQTKKLQLKETKSTKKKNKTFDDMLEEAAKLIKDEKKQKLGDDKTLIKAYSDSIKSLSKDELKAMADYVKHDFYPKKDTLLWAKKVIGENTSLKSKMLMYCNEIKK